VDVNVHPAKAQVRFKSQDRVFSFVQRSARRALLAYSPVASLPSTQNLWGSNQSSVNSNQFSGGANQLSVQPSSAGLEWALAHDVDRGPMTDDQGQTPVEATSILGPSSAQQASIPNLPIMRLVGQIGATYLVAEGPDGLYLIDQHAAHERVLFEKLMALRQVQDGAQHDQKNIPSQTMLTPQVVQVPPSSAKVLEEQLPILQHFGFTVEAFGPNAFQVRAIPALFADTDPAAALRALVEDFEEDESPLQNEIEAKIAARVCNAWRSRPGRPCQPKNSARC